MPTTILANSLKRLKALHPAGTVIFSTGQEGSGKTTLMNAISSAVPEAGIILYSTALGSYLMHLEQLPNASEYALAIEKTRKAMSIRDKKSIPPSITCAALRHGMKVCAEAKQKLVFVDGFPRTEHQADHASEITHEHYEESLLVSLEALCTRDESFKRATRRGKTTDTEEFITTCHNEYFGQLEKMRSSFWKWSHHLQVSTEGLPEESVQNLADTFSRFVQEIGDGQCRKVAVPKALAVA